MAQILTVEQAAEKLQMSPKAVRKYLRTGKLPGRKIGKAWRLLESDLERYVRGEAAGQEELPRISMLGTCADIEGLSTEEFMGRKQEEIEIENRRFRETQQ